MHEDASDRSEPFVKGEAPREHRATSVRDALLAARERGDCALVPYLTLGYPTLDSSLALLGALEDMGVDAVEVGVPFSDPVADGPTIQRTIDRALAQGVTLRRALQALATDEQRSRDTRPRVLFSYLNPLLAFGLAKLPAGLISARIGAVLVTDLIPEEAGEWLAVAEREKIETCFLVASTSDQQRLDRAARSSSGFVYCISTLGVTGARQGVDPTARETVSRLRERHDAPVAVGFGIASPEDVRQVAAYADGVVVGSALLNALGDATREEDVVRRGTEFLEPLLEAAHA
jgi:tryptophan synthase alpha chain